MKTVLGVIFGALLFVLALHLEPPQAVNSVDHWLMALGLSDGAVSIVEGVALVGLMTATLLCFGRYSRPTIPWDR